MSSSEPSPVLGRYEPLAEIASGGMAVVLLARLAGMGGFQRLFAIKVMHPHLVESPEFVAMLLDEARLAARIHHPNVVATVDVGNSGRFYYVVMDYVEGFELARIVEDGPLEPRQRVRVALRILLDAMFGLDAAHNLRRDDGTPLGIVHRDVSPENILIGIDGVGRLTDFGIALAASRITASRPGMIKGKPAYLSPEQARALPVDRRSDIWALGVILWEVLTGTGLFTSDTDASTVLRVVSDPIPSPRSLNPEIPAELEAVCLRALSRDPALRHPTARAMAIELEGAAERANLLADPHEVAATVNEYFGVEIAGRRLAVQRSMQAAALRAWPVRIQDVYELPKLDDDGSALGAESSSKSRLVPDTSSGSSPEPTSAVQAEATPRKLVGVVALLALGLSLVSLCTQRGALSRVEPQLDTAIPASSPRAAGAAIRDASVPRREPIVVPEARTAAPPSIPSRLGLAPASRVALPADAPRTPASRPGSALRPPRPEPRSPYPDPVRNAAPARPSSRPTPSPSLQIEENPYRFR